jgi:hypothetical protein
MLPHLTVAGGAVDDGFVERVAVDYRGGRVVKVERLARAPLSSYERVRGQGGCATIVGLRGDRSLRRARPLCSGGRGRSR